MFNLRGQSHCNTVIFFMAFYHDKRIRVLGDSKSCRNKEILGTPVLRKNAFSKTYKENILAMICMETIEETPNLMLN